MTSPPPAGFSERYWRLVSSFLPSRADTLLLRAMLLSGDAARDAWSSWCEAVGDPIRTLSRDRRHRKVLVPFMAARLRANGIEPGAEFNVWARAAHLTETLRSRAYLAECARVLDRLTAHGIDHLVLKGPALADVLYGDPALRHSHDFDVLIGNEEAERAHEILRASGFDVDGTPIGEGAHHLPRLRNRVGLAVEVHTRPTFLGFQFDTASLMRRSRAAVVGGVRTRMPGLADSLVLIAVHAVGCTSSANLRWACETWLLARMMAADDWRLVEEIAGTSNVGLPLAITLGYVAEEIGPSVPASVLEHLREAARRSDRETRSAIAYGARCSLPLTLSGIAAMDESWPFRLEQLLWRIVPPPRHVRWTYGFSQPWRIGLHYPARLLRAARDMGKWAGLDGATPR
jgi:hypothetical protein